MSVCLCALKLCNNQNDSSGARDGHAKAGAGGGAKKKGGTGEKATGGDEQTPETHRPGGENARKTESTGRKQKQNISLNIKNDLSWCHIYIKDHFTFSFPEPSCFHS